MRALARKTSDCSHLKSLGTEIIFGDVQDYDSLRKAVSGVDVVFHAAARVMPGWGSWQDYEATIVKGTENILKASVDAKVSRFVYVSSGVVLGKACRGGVPADEATPCEIVFTEDNYYDYAKHQAEQMALEYHREGKLTVTVVRPCIVYGPRDRYITDRFHLLASMPVFMWPGKGDHRAPLVYVTDVADSAIVAAMSQQAVGQVYNIAPLDEVRFSDFAAALAKAKGKKLRKLTVPMSLAYAFGLLVEWWAKLWRFKQPPLFTRSGLCFFEEGMFIDGSKIVRELGWQPKVPLEEGARLYVEWRCAQGKKKTI